MIANTRRMLVGGLVALAVGVAIGVGATEFGSGKSSTGKPTDASSSRSSSTVAPGAGLTAQTLDPFQQFGEMQMQMDRMFNQMSSELRSEPQWKGIPENPGYSLSLNVEDMKDRFVVHVFLPDTKASDVNVKLENQTLKVDVSNQLTEVSGQKNAPAPIAEWGQYEQTIQLPGPVKTGQMKIDRKDHELIISVPKA